jgi:hypothetical protein
MIRVSQGPPVSFSVFFVVSLCSLFLFCEPAPAEGQKALPKAAQEKIQKALSASPGDKVLVFNGGGDITTGATVSKDQAQKYNSLGEFLKTDEDSPAKSCSDPVPTPPPPCIICSSGEVVCSKVTFSTEPRSHSDNPRSNTPEDQKPQ